MRAIWIAVMSAALAACAASPTAEQSPADVEEGKAKSATDLEEVRLWYERAAKAGDPSAVDRERRVREVIPSAKIIDDAVRTLEEQGGPYSYQRVNSRMFTVKRGDETIVDIRVMQSGTRLSYERRTTGREWSTFSDGTVEKPEEASGEIAERIEGIVRRVEVGPVFEAAMEAIGPRHSGMGWSDHDTYITLYEDEDDAPPHTFVLQREGERILLTEEGREGTTTFPMKEDPKELGQRIAGQILERASGIPSPDEWKRPGLSDGERHLRLLAEKLDTPKKLERFLRSFWQYTYDSASRRHPREKGTKEHHGEYWQLAQETLQRIEESKMLGDCDDLAFLAQEILQRQGKSAHVIGVPAHAICMWADFTPSGAVRVHMIDTGYTVKTVERKRLRDAIGDQLQQFVSSTWIDSAADQLTPAVYASKGEAMSSLENSAGKARSSFQEGRIDVLTIPKQGERRQETSSLDIFLPLEKQGRGYLTNLAAYLKNGGKLDGAVRSTVRLLQASLQRMLTEPHHSDITREGLLRRMNHELRDTGYHLVLDTKQQLTLRKGTG